MLATIIRDAYRVDEREQVLEALEWITPEAGWGWHPAGVYCYWDPWTGEILYLGLATNLGRRFAQHNFLAGSSARGNKRREIANWFKSHSHIGFSVIVQSSAVEFAQHDDFDTPSEIVATGEGQLIRAHKNMFGRLPPWNKIGGSLYGASWAGSRTPGYFGLLNGRIDNLMVARRTIRQLADQSTAFGMEQTVHGARLWALSHHGMGGGVGDEEIRKWFERLRANPVIGDDPIQYAVIDDFGYLNQEASHPERSLS